MKHVLMLPSWLESQWGGAGGGTFFIEQAAIMRQYAGWKVNMLYPLTAHVNKVTRHNLSPSHGMEVKHSDGLEIWVGYYSYYFSWNRCHFGEKLFLEYVREHGMPEVLWMQAISSAGKLARHLSQKYDIPYFIHEHSAMYAHKTFRWWKKRRIKTIIKGAVYCAAVSDDLRRGMLRQIAVYDNKISVVHNPVNIVFADAELSSRSFGGVFIAVQLLRADKNIDKILGAFAALHKEYPQMRLVIVGDGPEMDNLKQLAHDMQLCDSVKFTGVQSREQVCAHLRVADYFVSASDYETFGLSLAEAMVCGLPSISNRWGIAEILVNEKTGVLLEKISEENIADAMRIIMSRRYDSAHIRNSALAVSSPQTFAHNVQKQLSAKITNSQNHNSKPKKKKIKRISKNKTIRLSAPETSLKYSQLCNIPSTLLRGTKQQRFYLLSARRSR